MVNQKLRDDLTDQLCRAILSLDTMEECYQFFEDVCTIGELRAMAQRDPLVEYQREGYGMFQQMMGAIKEEAIGFLFNIEVEVTPAPAIDPSQLTYTAPNEDGAAEAHGANEARGEQKNENQGQQKPADGSGSSFFRS